MTQVTQEVASGVPAGRFFAAPAAQPPGTSAATFRKTYLLALHLSQSATHIHLCQVSMVAFNWKMGEVVSVGCKTVVIEMSWGMRPAGTPDAIAIKLGIPRQKFANISIVLVLSEAEPSGPRPRIGAYFEDEGRRRVRSWKYLSLIAMRRTPPCCDCSRPTIRSYLPVAPALMPFFSVTNARLV